MFRILLSVVFIIITCTTVFADVLKDENEIRKFTDSVMTAVASNDLKAAFERMKPYAALPSTEVDAAFLQTKTQRDQVGDRYGKVQSYEYISFDKIATSLIRVQYIEKTDKTALPWIFYFYKTEKGWTLNTFSWSDNVKVLF